MSDNSSGEGLFVAWGLLIIVICIIGSLSTGMGPLQFFLVAAFAVLSTLIVLAFVLGITVTVVNLLRISAQNDERSFFQRLKEDYNWKAVRDDYKLIVDHVRIYASDEWQAGPGPAIEQKFAMLGNATRDIWNTQIRRWIRKD